MKLLRQDSLVATDSQKGSLTLSHLTDIKAKKLFPTGKFRLQELVESILECIGDVDDLVTDVYAIITIHLTDLIQCYDIRAVHAHELL